MRNCISTNPTREHRQHHDEHAVIFAPNEMRRIIIKAFQFLISQRSDSHHPSGVEPEDPKKHRPIRASREVDRLAGHLAKRSRESNQRRQSK